MAALLGEACCKPFVLCGDACNKSCSSCSRCCDKSCKWCGETCEGCCGCCQDGCQGVCNWIDALLAKPYSGCVLMTVSVNSISLAVMTYFVATNFSNDCANNLAVWLLVAICVFAINTAFGVYLYKRLSKVAADESKHDPNVSTVKNQFNQGWHFFMYDPVVCVFILILVFSIAWGFVGLGWSKPTTNGCGADFADLASACKYAAYVLLSFVGFGILCIVCSLSSGYVNECLDDCDCVKCMCCCIYYPCCYEGAKDDNHNHKGQQQQRPPQAQYQPQDALPAANVAVAYPAPAPTPAPERPPPQNPMMYAQPVAPAAPAYQPPQQQQYQSAPAYQPQQQYQQQPQQQQPPQYQQQQQQYQQQPAAEPEEEKTMLEQGGEMALAGGKAVFKGGMALGKGLMGKVKGK